MSSSIDYKKFIGQLERGLKVPLSDCFQPETDRIRNALLFVSFVIMLQKIGLIELSIDKMKFSNINMDIDIHTHLSMILSIVCLYLLVIFSLRSYLEWSLWKLKSKLPFHELNKLFAIIKEGIEKDLIEGNQDLSDLFKKGVHEIDFAKGYERIARQKQAADLVSDAKKIMFPSMHIVKTRLFIEAWFPFIFGIVAISMLFW